ncbi:adenylyl-sulfate kinase [Echinicola marina]|uniref:adenylyl-sulfate kinase n=1 Tax=Echinicola marina TaxID=2859768 RepID=UPI001CF6A454|nr:adenylyl-sulfate kinase [Echinicola marina]UCS95063.1 adenylyl-sulfate kinase [Echinicola marina]
MNDLNKAIWFFGLSGAGKSTLASALHEHFRKAGVRSIVLDGDKIRKGISSGLDFSKEDRRENVRRIAEVCRLMLEAEVIPIVAAITPFEKDRDYITSILGKDVIEWVFVNCPLHICENRDPKGLYKKVRKGKIKSFTGIDQEFEIPFGDVLSLNTDKENVEDCLQKILSVLSVSVVRRS